MRCWFWNTKGVIRINTSNYNNSYYSSGYDARLIMPICVSMNRMLIQANQVITIDVASEIDNYSELTSDNFYMVPTKIIVTGSASTFNFIYNYSASTGKLQISFSASDTTGYAYLYANVYVII